MALVKVVRGWDLIEAEVQVLAVAEALCLVFW